MVLQQNMPFRGFTESTIRIISGIRVFASFHPLTKRLAATFILQHFHSIQPMLHMIIRKYFHHGGIPFSYTIKMYILAFFQIVQTS